MPPPLPLPRLRIWPQAVKMCLPSMGTVEAIPMTPHPPSSASLRRGFSDAGRSRREDRIGRAVAMLAAAPRLAVAAARAVDGDEVGGAQDRAVGAERDRLGHVVRRADASGGHDHDLVADALDGEEAMHARHRVLDG